MIEKNIAIINIDNVKKKKIEKRRNNVAVK